MTPTSRAALAALALAAAPAPLAGQQNLYPEASVMGGVEVRQYNFRDQFVVDNVRQIAFPAAVVVPVGQRFSFDIGTWYAVTSVEGPGGDDTFSSLTDTQLRMAYVFGSDAVVASLMVNLPTGKETTTLSQFNVASSASSNFLLFPVNTYGSGLSVTPGLAGAVTAGSWNLGLAASVRWSDDYEPFSGGASGVTYEPGLETRIRAGADRLVGRSRLQLGFTFSTFANDELRGGGFGGTFDPGNRLLADAAFLTPAGRGTVSIFAWNYYRSASGSSGEKENVFTAGLAGTFPVGQRHSLEPVVEARIWSPETGSGYLFGAGTGFRLQVSPTLAFVPSGRVDIGSVDSNGDHSIFGWGLSALFRYTIPR